MTADIVQRVDTFLGVADDNLSAAQGDRAHAALGNIGEGKGRLKLGIAHVARRAQVQERSAHFNRDASPIVLNLSAVSFY
jgi:hypothetical protein